MSVTVSIQGNHDWCREHGRVVKVKEECCCVFKGEAEEDCFLCNGSGIEERDEYPFQLNLANGNFARLCNDLGIKCEPDGEIDGRTLLSLLGSPELHVRDTVEHGGDGPFMLTGGITLDQATRYHARLREIALEAQRREALVVWG